MQRHRRALDHRSGLPQPCFARSGTLDWPLTSQHRKRGNPALVRTRCQTPRRPRTGCGSGGCRKVSETKSSDQRRFGPSGSTISARVPGARLRPPRRTRRFSSRYIRSGFLWLGVMPLRASLFTKPRRDRAFSGAAHFMVRGRSVVSGQYRREPGKVRLALLRFLAQQGLEIPAAVKNPDDDYRRVLHRKGDRDVPPPSDRSQARSQIVALRTPRGKSARFPIWSTMLSMKRRAMSGEGIFVIRIRPTEWPADPTENCSPRSSYATYARQVSHRSRGPARVPGSGAQGCP